MRRSDIIYIGRRVTSPPPLLTFSWIIPRLIWINYKRAAFDRGSNSLLRFGAIDSREKTEQRSAASINSFVSRSWPGKCGVIFKDSFFPLPRSIKISIRTRTPSPPKIDLSSFLPLPNSIEERGTRLRISRRLRYRGDRKGKNFLRIGPR